MRAGAVGALLIGLTTAAAAQDGAMLPSFGTHALDAGFSAVPFALPLTAGGSRPAAMLSPSCSGTVAIRPDVRIVYRAGPTLPLQFHVRSEHDTTLVVSAPDGAWWCNDDTDGNDPAIYIARPLSGPYDIWVGSIAGGGGLPAVLHVTEFPQRR